VAAVCMTEWSFERDGHRGSTDIPDFHVLFHATPIGAEAEVSCAKALCTNRSVCKD
jgi:hypothetical protein